MISIVDLVTNEKTEISDIVNYKNTGNPIHIVSEHPSKNDIVLIHLITAIPIDDLNDALDIDEQPRLEDNLDEDPSFLKLVLRSPALDASELLGIHRETTYPMIIFMLEQKIVSIQHSFASTKIRRKKKGKNPAFDISIHATLGIIEKVVSSFEYAVNVIDRTLDVIEADIFKTSFRYQDSMKKAFQLARSGTYLDAALSANLSALRRMSRLNLFKTSEEMTERLEDIIIDLTQQQELLIIYKKLIENSIDGFASIVSNNQNNLLKLLASISLILTIPTTLSSLYGMNVLLPFQENPWAFWIIIGISALMIVPTLILLRKLTLL